MAVFGSLKKAPVPEVGAGQSIFAPPPYTAAPQPAKEKGLGRFFDNLLNPDASTWQGKLGLLAAHIGAQYGSPLANATLGIAQQQQAEMRDRQKGLLEERLLEARLAETERGPQPTTLERNYGFISGIDPQLGRSFLEQQAIAPPMVISNPDGTKTILPAGAVQQGIQKPVGTLTPIGGPASASGSFR